MFFDNALRGAAVAAIPLLAAAGALALWHLGFPQRALDLSRETLALARSLNHPFRLSYALHHAGWAGLEVDLLLTSQPQRTYKGRLHAGGLGGETTVKNNAVVLPARVRIADDDLAAQLGSMPVGVEVRAMVHCGDHAVGYVWFHGLWELLYEHVLF